MIAMSVSDVARLFGVSERTAREWVRDWHQRQGEPLTPVVRLAPPASGKGRTRYTVNAESLAARFPLLAASLAA